MLATLAVVAVLSTGCAQKHGLYQWGGYDTALYKYYKSPEQAEALRVSLEQHVAAMEKSQQKVAPGLYAELGTMYLQKGDRTKAAAMYAKERDAWPESAGLMTALIRTAVPPAPSDKPAEAAAQSTAPSVEAKESL